MKLRTSSIIHAFALLHVATAVLCRLLNLGDELALTYFDIARSLTGLGDFTGAEDYYRRGLTVPDAKEMRPRLERYFAGFLGDRGRHAEALEVLDAATDVPDLHPYTQWLRARCLLRLGEAAGAAEILLALPEVRDVQYIGVPRTQVLREALQACADAGRREDATVVALTLVARHGDREIVSPLLTLWGSRSPVTLGALLSKALGAGRTAAEVAALLRTDPRGAAAADVLDPAGAAPASEPAAAEEATAAEKSPVHV